jgi:mannose-6-phosphate isomerase-like protein (cupin superfamily)
MINKTNENNSRFGKYDGFTTNLLIGECNTGCDEISIQITEVEPGKMQTLHKHPQYQCYYVIQGSGQIIIDEEEKELTPGEAVLIPANAKHGIRNVGKDSLRYLTANRAFGIAREMEIWFSESKTDNTEMKMFE